MKYYILTKAGISDNYYHHTDDSPIYGSGQGSGNAGTEWNYVSIPLMATLEGIFPGCEIIIPENKKWNKTIIAFVDDTKQFNNKFIHPQNIIKDITDDAQKLCFFEKV